VRSLSEITLFHTNNKYMTDSVKVFARVRQGGDAVELLPPDAVAVKHPVTHKSHQYTFDGVMSPPTSQLQLFDQVVMPMMSELLQGFNATVMAYGQTGSGKTYTMMGTEQEPGIIPRVANQLFALPFTSVQVSYLEVYMEQIRDLFQPEEQRLAIREHEGHVSVPGATLVRVTDAASMNTLLKTAGKRRAMASTKMNEQSSRSHAIATIHLTTETTTSKMMLVDLAGSEQISKSGVTGVALKETQQINKSLSSLAGVIQALTDAKQTHIPYRDSKLTRLLSDSLGGTARTVLILALSSEARSASETLSTLQFGARAKEIRSQAVRHEIPLTLSDYKNRCVEQESHLHMLQDQVRTLELQLREKPAIVELPWSESEHLFRFSSF
jgi:kinesin family protein 5